MNHINCRLDIITSKLKINFEELICLFLYEGVIIQCISLYSIVCVESVISDLFSVVWTVHIK